MEMAFMKRLRMLAAASAALALGVLIACGGNGNDRPALAADDGKKPWLDTFPDDKADLTATGKNAYFILEPDSKEHKCYAPGIGLIQDGELKLTRFKAAGK
jgi:hypothetical protein